MRIYDLHLNFEELIKNPDFQIEIIGELCGWTVKVSSRTWSNELQRHEYKEVGSCTTDSFLQVYDFAAEIVFHERFCSLGYDMKNVSDK